MPEQQSIDAGDPAQKGLWWSFGRPPWAIVTLLGVLAAAVAVGIVWWTFEPRYEATTWLRIKSQQPFLAFAPAESDSAAEDLFVQTQVELVRSPLVLAPVAGQPEAAKVPELQEEDDPIEWLAENIKVKPVGKSELLQISLACRKAKDSALIVNQVAHEYLLLLEMDEAERSRQVISTLKAERSSREKEVKRLREDLRQLTKQVTGEDPFSPVPTTNPNLDHPLTDLNSRLITTEVEQTILAAKIMALENQLADRRAKARADIRAEDPSTSIEESGSIGEALEQDPEILRLQEQIGLSQAMLDDRESKLPAGRAKDERGCIALRNAISEGKELLDNRCAVVRERIKARLAASRAGQFESHTAQLEEELAEGRGEPSEAAVERVLSEHAGLQVIETLLLAKQSNLLELELRRELDKEDPRYQALQNEVKEDGQRLERFRADLREQIKSRLNLSQTAQLKEELAAMKSKYEGCRITKELLQERYEIKLGEAGDISGSTLELHFKQDELARSEHVLAVLSERILRLTTEQRAPERVDLLRPAEPAKVPLAEVPYVAMGVASAGGFCLPFLIVGLCCLLCRSRTLEDPVFRRIRLDEPRLWIGEVAFHSEGVVGVAVSAGQTGPTDADRKAFLELQRRYQDLKPSIANLLFDQYKEYQGDVAETSDEPEVPMLSHPEEIWNHTCLAGFRIDKGPNSSMPYLRLAYGFEWDESRLFFVYLWDWEVVRVEIDDG